MSHLSALLILHSYNLFGWSTPIQKNNLYTCTQVIASFVQHAVHHFIALWLQEQWLVAGQKRPGIQINHCMNVFSFMKTTLLLSNKLQLSKNKREHFYWLQIFFNIQGLYFCKSLMSKRHSCLEMKDLNSFISSLCPALYRAQSHQNLEGEE